MLYKIRCIPMHPLMVLYLCHICQCGLHAALWWHIGILMRLFAAEPRSTTWPLFSSQCPCGPILLTQYSMVAGAGPMLIYWPKLLDPLVIVFYYFFFSLLSHYRLLDWDQIRLTGWKITLSALPCRPLWTLIIIIIIIWQWELKDYNLLYFSCVYDTDIHMNNNYFSPEFKL